MFRKRGKRKFHPITLLILIFFGVSECPSRNQTSKVTSFATLRERNILKLPEHICNNSNDGLLTKIGIVKSVYKKINTSNGNSTLSKIISDNTSNVGQYLKLDKDTLNASTHLCSMTRYQTLKKLKDRRENNLNEFKFTYDFNPTSSYYTSSEYTAPEDSGLEYESDGDTYYTSSMPQAVDILPGGCHFEDNDMQTKTVICTGSNMTIVPLFQKLRSVDVLIFNNTGIQVLDRGSIERLPKVVHLIFKNGVLMRVAFNILLSYQPSMTALSLVQNSVFSLSFSNFYTDGDEDVVQVLDLRNNLISNLPQTSVRNETVMPHLKILIMGGNPMGVIPGDLFFPLRSSPVTTLFLRESGIMDYGKPSFADEKKSPFVYLPLLECLDLSRNPFLPMEKLEDLFSPFRNGRIRSLLLNDNSYLQVPVIALNMVKHSIEHLSLMGSSFYCLDNSSFPSMPELKILDLKYSRISTIMDGTFNNMISLEILYLDGNILLSIPSALSAPPIRVLTLDGNPSQTVGKDTSFSILENSFKYSAQLQVLSMAKVPLLHVLNFYFSGLVNLIQLTLEECSIALIQDESFIKLGNLEVLYLHGNKLQNISELTFIGLSNLKYLDLSDNHLNFYHNMEPTNALIQKKTPIDIFSLFMAKMFSSKINKRINNMAEVEHHRTKRNSISYVPLNTFTFLTSLVRLNLRYNEINFISFKIFQYFPTLREVDLSHNRIQKWDEVIFSNNPHLNLLSLYDNEVETITDGMIKDLSKPDLVVDLRRNSLICSCGLHAFNEELNNTKFIGRSSYTCLNGSDYVALDDYLRSELPCEDSAVIEAVDSPSLKKFKLFGILAGLTVICLTVATTTYRNRWYLKYIAYKLRVKVRSCDMETCTYEYDTFVCYSQADRQWIFEKLIGKLESAGSGLRVCVHERDFVVGENIAKNIIHSVEVSRKVIVVISRAFVQSSWCMFELQMASNKILDERKNKLILLLLEHIPPSEQPKELKHLLKSRTYVSWVTDIAGEKLFWARLLRAIAKPTSDDDQLNSESSDVTMTTTVDSTYSVSNVEVGRGSLEMFGMENFLDELNDENDSFSVCSRNAYSGTSPSAFNDIYINQSFKCDEVIGATGARMSVFEPLSKQVVDSLDADDGINRRDIVLQLEDTSFFSKTTSQS